MAADSASSPDAPKNAEEKKRIVDREPFDRIFLDDKNDNVVIEVFSLTPESRKPPEKINSASMLRIRLIKSPELEYDCAWSAIVKIDSFETILMQESRRLIDKKLFNDAYEYLDRVRMMNPNAPGLKESMQSFLYQNGGYLFSQEKYSEALAVMEELYRVNPNYKPEAGTLAAAINKLSSEIVSRYMEKKDYDQARQMLVRLRKTYGEKQKAAIERGEAELTAIATKLRDKAKTQVSANRMGDALITVKDMMNVWPDVEGGRALAKSITEQYPLVVVGVGQLATVHDTSRFEDWSARRTGRLMRRRLCEFAGRGPEGGLYESPLGKIETSDDGRQMTLLLDPTRLQAGGSTISGYDIADRLLALATPNDEIYLPAWGSLVSGISVLNVNHIRIDFRRSHVLPQALLQTLSDFEGDAKNNAASNGPYLVGHELKNEVHFLANKSYPLNKATQPKEIVERVYEKSDGAMLALRRGEVDMLDRIFPADLGRLRRDPNVIVGKYTLPTLHLLVPNPDKPFTGNRTFRRAILYGIDRATILNREICGGAEIPGCRLISGPFPPGLGANDPLAYAYDDRIKPRPYNPRLALTLIRLAEKELAQVAKKREEPEPKLQPLVIGLPATEAARVSCEAIVQQLNVIGIQVSLKELEGKQLQERQADCDFTYVELALWEPAVDAVRLLGPGGYLPETNAFVGLALRRLERVGNWKDASETLKDLHRIVYDDVTVLPLWQVTEHYAYRTWLTGVEKDMVQLYQSVEQWRVAARGVEE